MAFGKFKTFNICCFAKICGGVNPTLMHYLFIGPLSALYKDVNVVHPSLLSCVEPLKSQQVRELLRRLGVHELEPQELLEQHIYPSIQNNKWKVPYCINWINCHRNDFVLPIIFGLNISFFLFSASVFLPVVLLIPPPVKARISGGELLGFHQAAFLLQPGVLRPCSTCPHQQGSAVPGQ